MTTDMDIDMEIDLGPEPDFTADELQVQTYTAEPGVQTEEIATTGVPAAYGDDLMDASPVVEKVHIRGLDQLSTNDVRRYAEEHFSVENLKKVEWINDTSANYIFSSAEAADQALRAFTDTQQADPALIPMSQSRPAKRLSSHPDMVLEVRQATTTDVKARNARDASRYYLMNPDQDPRERRKREQGDSTDYKRRRFDDQEHKRRQNGTLDASMYDDDASALAARDRRRSRSPSHDSGSDRRKRVRFDRNRQGGDLFSDKLKESSTGRLRNRSASPMRDRSGDGRLGFNEDNTSRSRIRQRSLTPPAARKKMKGADLFASKLFNGNGPTELFPAKVSPNKTKELFPNRTPNSNHRRTEAIDMKDETSETAEKVKLGAHRDLFDRLDRPLSGSDTGRLKGNSSAVQTPDFGNDQGISIKGAAAQQQSGVGANGFSIRGAATASGQTELFPTKRAPPQTDLFAEKLKGRGGPRRRAEDLFG